jgi:NADPH:quinone reductase-like Zn-dependent oxidoreductase
VQGYVLTRYGNAGAMQLREVPVPTAGAGEVLIRVRAAGLNPVDYKVRRGGGRLFHLDLPLVAGSELSGVVDAVGAGATRFGIGDRVYARVDKQKLGAYAEYAVVDENVAGAAWAGDHSG